MCTTMINPKKLIALCGANTGEQSVQCEQWSAYFLIWLYRIDVDVDVRFMGKNEEHNE